MTKKRSKDVWRHRPRDTKIDAAEKALRRGPMTLDELADELGCGERTAYAVLEDLEDRGVPVAREIGNARGLAAAPRYFLAE